MMLQTLMTVKEDLHFLCLFITLKSFTCSHTRLVFRSYYMEHAAHIFLQNFKLNLSLNLLKVHLD